MNVMPAASPAFAWPKSAGPLERPRQVSHAGPQSQPAPHMMRPLSPRPSALEHFAARPLAAAADTARRPETASPQKETYIRRFIRDPMIDHLLFQKLTLQGDLVYQLPDEATVKRRIYQDAMHQKQLAKSSVDRAV